jgi:hypothetical protein
VFLSDAARA